ncbi:MAG: RNA-processing protein [Candidatus Aenigmarchaeota archaeon]|nr:RNA-processing protein [Candidatus Aenigmarchaeota archaeon]
MDSDNYAEKDIKIPEERKAVLIGRAGTTKNEIEAKTRTRINIGDAIVIRGDPLDVMVAAQIISAIGRGFPPMAALKLLDETQTLHIMNLPEKGLERVRARIIGTRGKARRRIERETKTRLSVYGKTVSVIGGHERVELAVKALDKLISGAPHKNAYRAIKKIKSDDHGKDSTRNGSDAERDINK